MSLSTNKRPMIEAAGDLHGRAVEEWIGATPDTKCPEKVALRILLRYKRRCYRTGVIIRRRNEWDLEHIIALVNGGQNRESNLAPIWRGKPHKDKTAEDVAEAAKVRSIQRKTYFKKTSGAFRRASSNTKFIDREFDPDT